MNPVHFDTVIRKNLMFSPTHDQNKAIELLQQFLISSHRVFILKGYAGTGKTTLIAALVNAMKQFRLKTTLMAPTGRAAKVMSNYADKMALTIHRCIYETKSSEDGRLHFSLKKNSAKNVLYIVDEASMVSHQSTNLRGSSLLSDLMTFVESGNGCKILFVGDTAQLPPVGQDESPALHEGYFNKDMLLKTELTEVVRQQYDSFIIKNATFLRDLLQSGNYNGFQFSVGPEVIRLEDSYDIQEKLSDAFQHEKEESILIVRSNKRANLYNQQIRQRILWLEDEISAGDLIMAVKNNYFWLDPKSPMGFIANGESMEILKYSNVVEFYGCRFADVTVRFPDFPNQPSIEVKILLDVLNLPSPAMSSEDQKKLYHEISLDYPNLSGAALFQSIINSEFYNALQVKFSYAVTCHKAQGGQWKNVFVEQSWMPTGEPDREYLRWLYTAITRSTDKVYLLGFTENYFSS